MTSINFLKSLYNYGHSGFVNVSEEKKEERLNICRSCNFFNDTVYQCKLCGCFLQIKTSWASEKCPINKWLSETGDKNEQLSEPIPASGDCGCNKK